MRVYWAFIILTPDMFELGPGDSSSAWISFQCCRSAHAVACTSSAQLACYCVGPDSDRVQSAIRQGRIFLVSTRLRPTAASRSSKIISHGCPFGVSLAAAFPLLLAPQACSFRATLRKKAQSSFSPP